MPERGSHSAHIADDLRRRAHRFPAARTIGPPGTVTGLAAEIHSADRRGLRRRTISGRRRRGSEPALGKKGRVFVRGMTSRPTGSATSARPSWPPSACATTPSSPTTPRSGTPATRAVPRLVAHRARATRTSSPRRCRCTSSRCRPRAQQRPRPPERGRVLHPRGRRLRDPRRPALRLEEGRPRLRPHRLGAPALQPLRGEGRRPRHQGQVHVDVPGPDPAGPQRPDRARGRVRPARGLVGHLDPRASWSARRSSPPRTPPGS